MTIPNLITILRFLLVPGVVFALLTDKMGWALAGFLVAGISDGIDGFIARQFNQRTELGAYMDPMADKVLLASVFVVLGYMGELPLWLVIAAVSRDALIVCAVLLSTVMGNPVAMKPLFVSKANTAVQIVLAAVVLGRARLRAAGRPVPRGPDCGLRALDRRFGRSLSRRLAEAHERLWRNPEIRGMRLRPTPPSPPPPSAVRSSSG